LKQGNHYQVNASSVKLIMALADLPQAAKDMLKRAKTFAK
jgi:hypothetical protein